MEIRTPNRLPFHRWAVFPVLLAQFVVLLLATLVFGSGKGRSVDIQAFAEV